MSDPVAVALIIVTLMLALAVAGDDVPRPIEQRAFMTALEAVFAGRNEIGDGELGRTLRDLQRKQFRPPG